MHLYQTLRDGDIQIQIACRGRSGRRRLGEGYRSACQG